MDIDKINDNLKRLEEQSDEIIEVMSLKQEYTIFLEKFKSLTKREKEVLEQINVLNKVMDKNIGDVFLKISDTEDNILSSFSENKKIFFNEFLVTRNEIVNSFCSTEALLKEKINNIENIANQNLEKNEQSLEINSNKIALIIEEINELSEKLNRETIQRKEILVEIVEEGNNSINENVKNLENIIKEEKNSTIDDIKKGIELEIVKVNKNIDSFKEKLSRELLHNLTMNSEKFELSSKNLYDNIYSENTELKKVNKDIKDKVNTIESNIAIIGQNIFKELEGLLEEIKLINNKIVNFENNTNGIKDELKNDIKDNFKISNLEINNKLLESNKLYLEKINELLVVNEKNKYEINELKKYGVLSIGVLAVLLLINIFLCIK